MSCKRENDWEIVCNYGCWEIARVFEDRRPVIKRNIFVKNW